MNLHDLVAELQKLLPTMNGTEIVEVQITDSYSDEHYVSNDIQVVWNEHIGRVVIVGST